MFYINNKWQHGRQWLGITQNVPNNIRFELSVLKKSLKQLKAYAKMRLLQLLKAFLLQKDVRALTLARTTTDRKNISPLNPNPANEIFQWKYFHCINFVAHNKPMPRAFFQRTNSLSHFGSLSYERKH